MSHSVLYCLFQMQLNTFLEPDFSIKALTFTLLYVVLYLFSSPSFLKNDLALLLLSANLNLLEMEQKLDYF